MRTQGHDVVPKTSSPNSLMCINCVQCLLKFLSTPFEAEIQIFITCTGLLNDSLIHVHIFVNKIC